jgi:transposase
MFHDSCYDRFKLLARRAQREKAVGPKAFRKGCPMCGKMAVNRKFFCSFCGFYK